MGMMRMEREIVIFTFPNPGGRRSEMYSRVTGRKRQNAFKETNNGTLIFAGVCFEVESSVCCVSSHSRVK